MTGKMTTIYYIKVKLEATHKNIANTTSTKQLNARCGKCPSVTCVYPVWWRTNRIHAARSYHPALARPWRRRSCNCCVAARHSNSPSGSSLWADLPLYVWNEYIMMKCRTAVSSLVFATQVYPGYEIWYGNEYWHDVVHSYVLVYLKYMFDNYLVTCCLTRDLFLPKSFLSSLAGIEQWRQPLTGRRRRTGRTYPGCRRLL